MITNLFLDIVAQLAAWIVSILPPFSVHLPAGVSTMVSMLMGFDAILPVSEGLACVTLLATTVAAVTLVKWTIKLVDWTMDVIP
jgi:hypothetical protein